MVPSYLRSYLRTNEVRGRDEVRYMSPHMHGSLSKVRSKVPSFVPSYLLPSFEWTNEGTLVKLFIFVINKDRGDINYLIKRPYENQCMSSQTIVRQILHLRRAFGWSHGPNSSAAQMSIESPLQVLPCYKVAILHPDLGIGGAERLILDAALELGELGCRVSISGFYSTQRDGFSVDRTGSPVHGIS